MKKTKVIVTLILLALNINSLYATNEESDIETDTMVIIRDIIPDNILFKYLPRNIKVANNEKPDTAQTEMVVSDVVITDSIGMDSLNVEDTNVIVFKKYIYLTIDDSPLTGSSYIDSIITATQTRVSVFMVGKPANCCNRFKKYLKKIKENPYIEIYNHSYSHAGHKYVQYYTDPEMVLADFDKNETNFDIQHKIARLPGRNIWHLGEKKRYLPSGSTSADLLSANGYRVYGWDIEWQYDPCNYKPKQSVEQLIKQIERIHYHSQSFTPNHVVLLMHDQMFGVRNGGNDLEQLINGLKELGYIFEYLTNYPG